MVAKARMGLDGRRQRGVGGWNSGSCSSLRTLLGAVRSFEEGEEVQRKVYNVLRGSTKHPEVGRGRQGSLKVGDISRRPTALPRGRLARWKGGWIFASGGGTGLWWTSSAARRGKELRRGAGWWRRKRREEEEEEGKRRRLRDSFPETTHR